MNDFDNLTSGPAQFLLDDNEIGHTAGGISANISPINRMRTVDHFGESAVGVVHQGDEVRLTVPFAEWAAATLAEVYNPGNVSNVSASSSGYIGVGRSSGYIYTTADAKIVPRLSADTAKKLQFWRATPIGELELQHNADDDRVFSTEFACLVDESKTDGELIGRIFVN